VSDAAVTVTVVLLSGWDPESKVRWPPTSRTQLPAHLHQVWPVFHPWHLRPAKKSTFRQQPITFLELNPSYEVEELIAT
jgi:hypothetical protein